MDKLNFEALEQIPIPEGLEERLSKKIDEWEKQPRPKKRSKLRYYAVAASVALVFGMGFHYLRQDNSVNLAEQDTYRALNLLAANLNKGMSHLEKATTMAEKANKSNKK